MVEMAEGSADVGGQSELNTDTLAAKMFHWSNWCE